MCNINILIRKKSKLRNQELSNTISFLSSVTSHSYINNNDGDGVYFNSGFLIRSVNKINMLDFLGCIKNSNIIMSHQRFATSGNIARYTQPFQNKNFVLVHNGVINDFLQSGQSDTFGFFEQFNEKFKGQKGNRDKRIIKSIKSLLDGLDYCSYSIALLDKKTECLYYFKNDDTNIHFYKDKQRLFITTNIDNKIFLSFFDSNFKEIEINDYTIYKIKVEGSINIRKIGNIKEREIKIISQQAQINKIDDLEHCLYCGLCGLTLSKKERKQANRDNLMLCKYCKKEQARLHNFYYY